MMARAALRLLVPCALLAAVACSPPEARRVQGGDAGADIGNRSPVVEMHAGSVVYPERRCVVQGAECTGPLPVRLPPTPPSLDVSAFVLEPMGRGGAVRPVIYTPPPDLRLPDPGEVELPFPGPGVPTDAPGHEEAAPTEPVPDDDAPD
jgi:hypothetical protein